MDLRIISTYLADLSVRAASIQTRLRRPATALGFVKLRVPTVEAVEALEILGLDPGDWGRIDGIMNAATVVRARVGTPSRARGGPYRVWGQSLVRTQVCRGDPQVDIP